MLSADVRPIHALEDKASERSTPSTAASRQEADQDGGTARVETGASATRSERSARRGGGHSRRDHRRKSFLDREWTTEEIDSFIEVAADVNPQWGQSLSQRRLKDPESVREAILSNGNRLIALFVLKERNPDLYEVRVQELRLQGELRELARQYSEAMQQDDTLLAETLRDRIRQKAQQQIDLDLKARAKELQALDETVTRLRKQLHEEAVNRQQSVDRLMNELLSSTNPDEPAGSGESDKASAE